MRRLVLIVAAVATLLALEVTPAAIAVGEPSIGTFQIFGPAVLVYLDGAAPEMTVQATAGATPLASGVVDLYPPGAATPVTHQVMSPNGTGYGAEPHIPWTAPPGLWTARFTVTGQDGKSASKDGFFTVQRQTRASVAFSPAAPHAGARVTITATLQTLSGTAVGGFKGLAGVQVGLGGTFRTTDSLGRVSMVTTALGSGQALSGSVYFAGTETDVATQATNSVTPTLNVTRIVGFDAGPEPAYRHAYLSFSGTLQYDDPNAVAWRPAVKRTITIFRDASYRATVRTDSQGHFALTVSGIASTVGGVWRAYYVREKVGDNRHDYYFLDASASGGDQVLTTTAPMRITRVVFDPTGADTLDRLNSEYVTITNLGIRTANIYGWTLRDRSGHVYTVSHSVYVPVGHSVSIHTGAGTDTATNLYWGQPGFVWDNAGDTAYLRSDLGVGVDSCAWSSGSATSC